MSETDIGGNEDPRTRVKPLGPEDDKYVQAAVDRTYGLNFVAQLLSVDLAPGQSRTLVRLPADMLSQPTVKETLAATVLEAAEVAREQGYWGHVGFPYAVAEGSPSEQPNVLEPGLPPGMAEMLRPTDTTSYVTAIHTPEGTLEMRLGCYTPGEDARYEIPLQQGRVVQEQQPPYSPQAEGPIVMAGFQPKI